MILPEAFSVLTVSAANLTVRNAASFEAPSAAGKPTSVTQRLRELPALLGREVRVGRMIAPSRAFCLPAQASASHV